MEGPAAWDPWPEHNPIVQHINLNDVPPPALDLNLAPPELLELGPDQHEMIIDPLFPPLVQQPTEQQMIQVNEAEEDADEVEEMEVVAPVQEQAPQPAEVDVVIPVLNAPVDVLPLEIQDDDLMNDEELQNQALMEAEEPAQGQRHNLFVGMVQIIDGPVCHLPIQLPKVQPGSLMNQFSPADSLGHFQKPVPGAFNDPSGLWGKFFAPDLKKVPSCLVPPGWANFFTAALLTPQLFNQDKSFLPCTGLLASFDESPSVAFVLPDKCPVSGMPGCLTLETQDSPPIKETVLQQTTQSSLDNLLEAFEAVADQSDSDKANDSDTGSLVGKEIPSRRMKKPRIIVDSEVRRSPRVKKDKKGFKKAQCQIKNCLDCNSAPPDLSPKALRKLGTTLCDLDPELLSDDVLSKKKKKTAPVGSKSAGKSKKPADGSAQP
jgi:hypothetical protein